METMEHNLEPLQGLKIITEAIAQTKENIKGHSYLFLLWGWLIAAASLLFFVLQSFTSFKLFFLPFPVFVTIGIVVSLVNYRSGQQVSQTYLGFYLKNLWLVLGIGFILSVLINLKQQYPPFTYTLLIGGVGTLVSGLVLRFKPLMIGGILFFAFSAACVFVPGQYQPLLQAIAVLTGYLIPGYLLKHSNA
ncbi:hypothetical protein [Chitinophaga flava]|uniref:Uncharacterized protein n=1 Tax=Chitinophaga flava TaxID=2259036 RepID=A0A365XSJ0_9BACT|nr:hypothetical protein [Chitinophaga flava]RBL89322.1 hypothetical protein DF182_22635 [Chitinophaga flava]